MTKKFLASLSVVLCLVAVEASAQAPTSSAVLDRNAGHREVATAAMPVPATPGGVRSASELLPGSTKQLPEATKQRVRDAFSNLPRSLITHVF